MGKLKHSLLNHLIERKFKMDMWMIEEIIMKKVPIRTYDNGTASVTQGFHFWVHIQNKPQNSNSENCTHLCQVYCSIIYNSYNMGGKRTANQ